MPVCVPSTWKQLFYMYYGNCCIPCRVQVNNNGYEDSYLSNVTNPNIFDVFNKNNYYAKTNIMSISNIQDDSKLLLGFLFIGHGNTDKN